MQKLAVRMTCKLWEAVGKQIRSSEQNGSEFRGLRASAIMIWIKAESIMEKNRRRHDLAPSGWSGRSRTLDEVTTILGEIL